MSQTPRRLRIAILGDRGIPARYGGYSTLIEEISVQLTADHDFEVVVYCRSQYYPDRAPSFKGVRLVYIPVLRNKYLESVLHTAMSTIHSLFLRLDAVLVIDPANAINLPLLRLFGRPAALHTDGLGFKRKKWGPIARAYYKFSERLSAWFADELVADALAMRDHYLRNYGTDSTFLPLGCESGGYAPPGCLAKFGLTPGEYYLVVTRIEPDNNTDLIIREYRKLATTRPLVIVGGARFPSDFSRQIEAEADDKVRVVGGVYDAEVLNALYRHAFAYLHGHEVGGTNPALLRAMAAGTCCAALDTVFSREVMGEGGCFFGFEAGSMAQLLQVLEAEPERARATGVAMHDRAWQEYRWDAVTAGYAALFRAMSERRKPGEVYHPADYCSRTPLAMVND
jgi:glycosyltransferase involved in cell wall biosynthesis